MRQSIILAIFAVLIACGCASMSVKRTLRDSDGRETGTITVAHPATTADGDDLLAAEAMSLGRGYMPQYGLPVLQQAVVPYQGSVPPTTQPLPDLQDTGPVPCPTDRSPVTQAERLSCLEKNQRAIAPRVFRRRSR